MYNHSYSGIDKKKRIDCLAFIRRMQNPPGHTPLDIDNLCKGPRNTKKDAENSGIPREPGKFVYISPILEYEQYVQEQKRSEQTYKDTLKVDVQPKPLTQSTRISKTTPQKEL